MKFHPLLVHLPTALIGLTVVLEMAVKMGKLSEMSLKTDRYKFFSMITLTNTALAILSGLWPWPVYWGRATLFHCLFSVLLLISLGLIHCKRFGKFKFMGSRAQLVLVVGLMVSYFMTLYWGMIERYGSGYFT